MGQPQSGHMSKAAPQRKEGEAVGATFNQAMTMDDFEMLSVVGKGSFGKVLQVRKRDSGKIYAMKILKKQQLVARKQVDHTKTERKVLAQINHPFIVSLRYAFQTQGKLYMVLDYFTGGELFFHLKNGGRFAEERAKFYAAEITLALQCLHENGVIYRDLKPENVLLDDEGHIKLTDFGLSKEDIEGNQMTHTFCGTPEYLAPEVIKGSWYGKSVDWWSMGTLLYEMITGLPPFYNENLHVMYERIMTCPLEFPDDMSEEAKSLLAGLLERDPRRRLGSNNGAHDFKDHPFFASINWEALYNKQVTPSFIPVTTQGVMSTDNIEPEFAEEEPSDTPVSQSNLAQEPNFESFSFNEANEMQVDTSGPPSSS